MEERLQDVSCVVFDLETTGFGHDARIVEVAAVRLEGWKPVAEFNTLINPEVPISYRATQVHKIDEKMVLDAPLFSQVTSKLAYLMQDALLVGHNIFTFDLRFLSGHMREIYGAGPDNWAVDTLRLARKLLPEYEKHKLELLADALGIPIDAHQAMSDVYATAELWLHLCSRLLQVGYRTVGDLGRFRALRQLDGSGLPRFHEEPDTPMLPRPTAAE